MLDDPGHDGEVLGHTDWRAENLRFDGEQVSSVYDWESLVRTSEPVLVGGVAHAFCSDWAHSPSGMQAPALDEARAFVSEFEDASGTVFDRADRRRMGAAYAYATAYTARCGHAIDPDGATEPGQGFRSLIREFGGALVDAFLAG